MVTVVEDEVAMVGRDAVLRRLCTEVDAGGLVVLTGGRGIGRTTVLGQLRDTLLAGDRRVLWVDTAELESWDTLGVGALLRALGTSLPRDAPASVLTAVNLLRSGFGAPAGKARLLDHVARLFTMMAGHISVVLLIDDADLLGEPAAVAASVAAAGHAVVVSTTPGRQPELARHARHVVELPPLGDSAVAGLIGERCGGTPAPRLRQAVAEALGTLAGSPAELTAAVSELLRQDRLVTVHDRVLLADAEPVRLPADHRLVRAVRLLGEPAVDLLLAAESTETPLVSVALLAAAGGWSTQRFGHTLDSLVRLGVLGVSGGVVEVACPAVAAAVTAEFADRGRRLHAKTVDMMLAARRDGGPFDERLFADHVAAAGARVRLPEDWPPRLLAMAVREADRHPERSVRWLRALRGLLDDPAAITGSLISLAMRLGDYAQLERISAEILGDRPGLTASVRRTLAVAATLTALHTGHRVPEKARAALENAAIIELGDRWLAGETPELAEFRSVFAPGAAFADDGTLERSLAARYPAPALAAILGPDYRRPERGFMAEVGRVVNGYLDGAWDEALDAAREVFAQRDGDKPGRELVALLAAEISTWSVGVRAARAWLDLIGPDPAYPLVLAWVRAGTALRANAHEDALAVVCAVLRLGLTDSVGLPPLLLRGAIAATLHGASRDDIALLCQHDTVDGITSALVNSDPAAVPPTTQGSLWSYVAIGLVDPDPRPWFTAAHDAANARGATILRGWLRRLMISKDLPPPQKPRTESGFSPRELHIIDQVRAGSTNRQIAGQLALSEKSVENYLARLFRRTSTRSRQELAAMAIDRVTGLSSPPFG